MKSKNYIKALLVLIMVWTFCLVGFSKEEKVDSIWSVSPVGVDGSFDDWRGVALNFEKKVNVDYAFKNDAEHLYILFIFKDPEYLSSINATGLNLWIDSEGKKKKKYGVKFIKKQVTSEEMISIIEKQEGVMTDDKKNEILSRPQYLFYQGDIIDKKEKSIDATLLNMQSKPATFRSNRQGTMTVYELRVPLGIKEFSDGKGIEPGNRIMVGFEWGGRTKEMIADMMRSRASSTRENVPDANLARGPKKYSFWLDVQLAQNQ